MTQNLPSRSLSESESRLLSGLAAADHSIFSLQDAQLLAAGTGCANVARMLHRLAAKGWLQRLERGKYRLIPLEAGPNAQWASHEYLVAAALVRPYYLAYGTALHYCGYTDRQPRPVWIATTRRKRPTTIDGVAYRFVTLTERKFFGYTSVQLLQRPVSVAEREKAIVDGFDHPEYCGGVLEPAKGLWFGIDELDLDRLAAFSQQLGNRSAVRRLGFWLEQLELADEALLKRLQMPADRNYARLDPTGLDTGPMDRRWRLRINIPENQLLEWREH
jgi:predicted transcriptional regulator of viral defense system